MKRGVKKRLIIISVIILIILLVILLIYSYFKITGKITIPSTSITTTCADNDNTNITNANDQSYYKKSSVNSTVSYSGTTTTNNDSCYSSTQLYEKYCAGNYANTKTFYCAYGCSNGACKGASIKSGEPFKFGSYQSRFADGNCSDDFDSSGNPVEFVISNGTMTKCCRFSNSRLNANGVCIQNDGRTPGKYLEMPVIYNNETSLECGTLTLKTYDANYYQFKDPIEQPAIGYTAQFNMRILIVFTSTLVPLNSYKFDFAHNLITAGPECFTLVNGEYVFDETKCDLRPRYILEFPCYSGTGTNTKTIQILDKSSPTILCSKSVGALCN